MSVIKKPWMAGPQMNSAQEQTVTNIRDIHNSKANEKTEITNAVRIDSKTASNANLQTLNILDWIDFDFYQSGGPNVSHANLDTQNHTGHLDTMPVFPSSIHLSTKPSLANIKQLLQTLNDKRKTAIEKKANLKDEQSGLMNDIENDNTNDSLKEKAAQLVSQLQESNDEINTLNEEIAHLEYTMFQIQKTASDTFNTLISKKGYHKYPHGTVKPNKIEQDIVKEITSGTDVIEDRHIINSIHDFAHLRALLKHVFANLGHSRNVITGLEQQNRNHIQIQETLNKQILNLKAEITRMESIISRSSDRNLKLNDKNLRLQDEISKLTGKPYGSTAAPAGAAQNPKDEDHGKVASAPTDNDIITTFVEHSFRTMQGDKLRAFYYTEILDSIETLISTHKNLKSQLQQFHNHENSTLIKNHLDWECAGYSDDQYLKLLHTLKNASIPSEAAMRKTGIEIFKKTMPYTTENQTLDEILSQLQPNQSSELHGPTAADAGTGQGNSGGYQPPAGTGHGTPGGHQPHAGTGHGHHGRHWHNHHKPHAGYPSGTRGGLGLTEDEKKKRKETLDGVINYMQELGADAAFYKPYYEYVKKTHGNNLQPISPPTTVIPDVYQTNLDLCEAWLVHWLCDSTTRGTGPSIPAPIYFKDSGSGYWVSGDATSV